jgi:hypothetical protein
MIKKAKSGYVLKTADGKRTLGKHPSRASAIRQERAIKIAQALRKHNGGK